MATGKTLDVDFSKCPICLEVIRSPKSLPCLHSFCEQCISEFICASNHKKEDKIVSFQCPLCRTVVTPSNPDIEMSKWASLLPSNLNLAMMLESVKEKQECHSCKRRGKSSIGIKWCRDCMEALCQTCSEFHSSIKLTVDHKVFEIGNANADFQEIDVGAISQVCPIHSSKIIEAFCFDHKTCCCVLCLTINHRKCNKVKAIEEISDEVKLDTPRTEVFDKLHAMIESSISRKQQEIDNFEESLKKSDKTARKYVACAKDKLDQLLLSFSKELSLLGDDKRAKLDDELRILNQLLNNINHLKRVATVVHEQGTLVQQFIHNEISKTQIINNTLPVISDLLSKENIDLVFSVDSVIEKIETLTGIGTLTTRNVPVTAVKVGANELGNLKSVEQLLGVRASPFELKYKKVITLPNSSYACGACLTDNLVVCAADSTGDINSLDSFSGAVKNRYNWHYAKRIAIDRQRNELYLTYKNGYFVKFSCDPKTGVFVRMKNFQSSLIGGLDIFENCMYIILGNTIRKTSIDSLENPDYWKVCFNVNTDCSNTALNSLVIDLKIRCLIYTSDDNEIIGTKLTGEQVFCFKDDTIERPTSLAIHSSGNIIVGNETGSVHIISTDGKCSWTLLEKCQNIKKLCDIWLNKSENILFLCGDNYLEIYDIVHKETY